MRWSSSGCAVATISDPPSWRSCGDMRWRVRRQRQQARARLHQRAHRGAAEHRRGHRGDRRGERVPGRRAGGRDHPACSRGCARLGGGPPPGGLTAVPGLRRAALHPAHRPRRATQNVRTTTSIALLATRSASSTRPALQDVTGSATHCRARLAARNLREPRTAPRRPTTAASVSGSDTFARNRGFGRRGRRRPARRSPRDGLIATGTIGRLTAVLRPLSSGTSWRQGDRSSADVSRAWPLGCAAVARESPTGPSPTALKPSDARRPQVKRG